MRIVLMIILAAMFCVTAPSCTIRYYDTERLLNDYKTEGFLDTDHFQVIIHGEPDKEKRGLVRRRESALRDARRKMEDTVVERLADYSLDYQVKKLELDDVKKIENMGEVREELEEEFSPFLEYGHIAFEYYNADHSAVIVYRIFKDDLVEDVESVEVDFKIKKEEVSGL